MKILGKWTSQKVHFTKTKLLAIMKQILTNMIKMLKIKDSQSNKYLKMKVYKLTKMKFKLTILHALILMITITSNRDWNNKK